MGKFHINKVADLDKHESIILMGVYNAVNAVRPVCLSFGKHIEQTGLFQ